MHPRTVIAAAALVALVAACALAVDVPTDEATKRKRLAEWQSDPEHWRRLQANLAALRAMPPDERERLRRLDKAILEQDQNGQARLRAVLERYAGWLARLSPDEQARIAAAPAGEKRLKVVGEIQDRQWEEALPEPDRDALAKADAVGRAKLLELLHKEDDERRKLRLTARRNVEEAALLGSLPNQTEFKDAVQLFVEDSLRPQLSLLEDQRLTFMAKRPQLLFYFQAVFELAESRGPIPFPGPAAPGGKKRAYRHWKDLPPEIVGRFTPSDLNNTPGYVASAEGKWPDLPLAVVKFADEKNYTIPSKLLGPTKADELPASVQKFLRDELLPKLSAGAKSELTAAEGKWPDYPKKVKELADRARLVVPGIALPGDEKTRQNIKNFKPGPGRFPPGP